MSIRQRTTKLIARRHDLNYFKRMSPLRAWQWMLAGGALLLAMLWFGSSTVLHGSSSLSAGPMSSSHAVVGQRCELCHIPILRTASFTSGLGIRRHVPDSACLSCHAAPAHHPQETTANPTCSSCHTEHIGSMHLAATGDRSCTTCHAQLQSRAGALSVAANIRSFASEHPEFRELRTVSATERRAATALLFNHAAHMKPGLYGPEGKTNLQCSACHVAVLDTEGRPGHTMAPVTFERSCQSCHSLEFDKHLVQAGAVRLTEAPHSSPSEVRAYVAEAISSFARRNPQVVSSEIVNWPKEAPLPGRIPMPPPHTQSEWITNRTLHAEAILWREKCSLCHRDLNPNSNTAPQLLPASFSPHRISLDGTAAMRPLPLPEIEAAHQPTRWFRDAVFSHTAHTAVSCEECHTKALTSASGTDILMPSIATCRKCHDGQSSPQGPPVRQGHAESGCVLCHVYHGASHVTANNLQTDTLTGQPLSTSSGRPVGQLLGR